MKPDSWNFSMARRLLSQLGYVSADNREQLELVKKDVKLLREIKHLDSQVP